MSYEDTAIFETESFEYIVDFEYNYNYIEDILELDDFTAYVEGVKELIQLSKELEQSIYDFLDRVLDTLIGSYDIDYRADYESSQIDYVYDNYRDRMLDDR